MTKLSLFCAIVATAALVSATSMAVPKSASIRKAYATALKTPAKTMTTTFIPLAGEAMTLYRAHKQAQRSPAVVVLNGKGRTAQSTFAIVANTDKFGLIAIFDRGMNSLEKGSLFIGKGKKKAEVTWVNGSSPAVPVTPAAQ